jgi:hypothetical protein
MVDRAAGLPFRDELESVTVDGETYWFARNAGAAPRLGATAPSF